MAERRFRGVEFPLGILAKRKHSREGRDSVGEVTQSIRATLSIGGREIVDEGAEEGTRRQWNPML